MKLNQILLINGYANADQEFLFPKTPSYITIYPNKNTNIPAG